MTLLVQTIDTAFASIGPEAKDRLRDVIDEFETPALTDENRAAALATAIAAVAARHHGRHPSLYLEALRTWSLEIADVLGASQSRLHCVADPDIAGNAAKRLYDGLDAAIDAMRDCQVAIRNRLVTELAVMARLLGQQDVATIAAVIAAVRKALADPSYRRGAVVTVHVQPVSPDAGTVPSIENLAARGSA